MYAYLMENPTKISIKLVASCVKTMFILNSKYIILVISKCLISAYVKRFCFKEDPSV